jgi:hypothetical protein
VQRDCIGGRRDAMQASLQALLSGAVVDHRFDRLRCGLSPLTRDR